jgi:hypothetical protein
MTRPIQARCPRCHRPRGWLCVEEGRPCEAVAVKLVKPRARPGRRTGTHPQRRRKTPSAPPPRASRTQMLEGLRRYYLRKYGKAA